MQKRVKSSEVLTPNAVTRVEVHGQVVSRFRPTGPNKWDDYEILREDGEEPITVRAGEKVQVEPLLAAPEIRFRVRRHREVLVLRWTLTEEDREALKTGKWGVRESEKATTMEKVLGLAPKDDPRDDMLEYFLDVKSEPVEGSKGLGAAAILVQKLKKGREP